MNLSEKECAVMHYVINGKRDKEIALLLGVTMRTVTHRVWSSMNKLGAETRAHAAVIFSRNGRE